MLHRRTDARVESTLCVVPSFLSVSTNNSNCPAFAWTGITYIMTLMIQRRLLLRLLSRKITQKTDTIDKRKLESFQRWFQQTGMDLKWNLADKYRLGDLSRGFFLWKVVFVWLNCCLFLWSEVLQELGKEFLLLHLSRLYY